MANRRKSTAAPNPVSNFDWHEGSGSTTASTVGAYSLTVSSWTTRQSNGPIGANAAVTDFTLLLDITFGSGNTGNRSVFHANSGPAWYLVGTAVKMWTDWGNTDIEFTGWTVTAGRHKLAFVFSGTTCTMFVDGVKYGSGTRSGGFSMNPNSVFIATSKDSNPVVDGLYQTVTYWNAVLTDAQAQLATT